MSEESLMTALGESNMNKKNIKLICRSVRFLSQGDERAFFEWINNIPSVVKYDGVLDELYLYIKSKNIKDADLRELIALFSKYQIKDATQLQLFLNAKNKKWFFDNHIAYWHEQIFGEKRLKLICNDAHFETDVDKVLFTRFIMRIPSVDELDDFGSKLHVYIKGNVIPDEDLKDIIVLFYQYKIDMKQLKIFFTKQNNDWLKNKDDYWHDLVLRNK